MKLIFQKSYHKSFWKLDRKLQLKVHREVLKLTVRPSIKNCKKLINFSPEYRIRVWDYRILFDISDDKIIIQDIKHRKDAYK